MQVDTKKKCSLYTQLAYIMPVDLSDLSKCGLGREGRMSRNEPLIAACDLGTGGAKTSLFSAEGHCVADAFTSYPTAFPQVGFHEQNPLDWWGAVVSSIKDVVARAEIDPKRIRALGMSGQSLAVVPLDAGGSLMSTSVPIWSDSRAKAEAAEFFEGVDEREWYMRTGNGFPRHLYSAFKLMWLRNREPSVFKNASVFVGSKDYVNYKLTGQIFTDPSYASGSGVWNLINWEFDTEFLEASGLPRKCFAEVVPSHEVIGKITSEAAAATGLTEDVVVVAGGVDNSCMALGARNSRPGRIYNSLGSSSWLAVSSDKPVLDERVRPFVFSHVVPGLFTSAVSIFSAGSSFRWVRDTICQDLVRRGEEEGLDTYELMTGLAAQSVVGSNGLIFNPSLAGGTSLDASPEIRGGWFGLDLSHTREDLIRSSMEGIAMGLEAALKELRNLVHLDDEIVVVGGGSNSEFWRQIYADIYNVRIVKTNIDDQAAALGAAALAAVGAGLWSDLGQVDEVHQVEATHEPNLANVATYSRMTPIFSEIAQAYAAPSAQLVALRREIEGVSQ